MSDLSDEQLMNLVSEGKTEAFGELVRRHQNRAWGIAYWFLKDALQAEDLAQEAFLKIFEAAPRYEPTAKFTTYLNRVVSRLCFDWIEKNKPKLIKKIPVEQNRSAISSPEQNLLEDELEIKLRKAVQKLPKRQRMAIILQHREELSYQEISETMGTSIKAVERLLARARDQLQEELAEFEKYL